MIIDKNMSIIERAKRIASIRGHIDIGSAQATIASVMDLKGPDIWILAFAIIIALYASIFAIVVSLWAVFAGEVGCVIGGILGAPLSFIAGNVAGGLLLLAGGLICIGLAILTFYACKIATKGLVKLVKLLGIAIKKLFIKKEKTV